MAGLYTEITPASVNNAKVLALIVVSLCLDVDYETRAYTLSPA